MTAAEALAALDAECPRGPNTDHRDYWHVRVPRRGITCCVLTVRQPRDSILTPAQFIYWVALHAEKRRAAQASERTPHE